MSTRIFSKAATSAALLVLAATPALALVPFAKGELFVTGQLRAEYDSNIYSSNRKIDDTIVTFTPGLSFLRNAGLIRLNVETALEIQRFADNTQHDAENGKFNSGLTWGDEEGKTDGSLSVGINRGAYANTYINDLTLFDRYTFSGNAGHWFTEKFGFRLLVDVTEERARQEGYSDVGKELFGADGRFLVSPKLETFAGYAFRTTSTNHDPANRSGLSTHDHRLSVGVKGDLSSKINGLVRVGYMLRDFTNSTLSTQNAPFAQASVNWDAQEKTSVNLTVTKDFDTTAISQSVNNFETSLSVTQRLLEKLSVTGSLSYQHASYVGGEIDRTDDLVSGRVTARYHFNDHFSGSVFATVQGNDSSFAVSDFSRNTCGVSLTTRF